MTKVNIDKLIKFVIRIKNFVKNLKIYIFKSYMEEKIAFSEFEQQNVKNFQQKNRPDTMFLFL